MKRSESVFMKAANKIEQSCAFGAIRQGLIMLIPLLVAGYGALMIVNLPIPAYQDFITHLWDGRIVEMLQCIHKGVNNFFAVILAVTTSVSYSVLKSQKRGEFASIGDSVILAIITLAALAGYAGIQYDSFSISSFGNMNTLTALFVSLISGQLYFATKNCKLFKIERQGTDTDSVYLDALKGIYPAIVILGFFAIFRQFLHLAFHADGLQELLEQVLNHAVSSIDSNFGDGFAVILVTHLLWFFGIHGHNVLDVVIKQNFEDITVGIFSKTFQDVFVLLGGTGATLCLVIAILLFARKKSVRNIALMAAPSNVFNICEIVLFGVPVILNPIFLIPFLLIPLLNYIISYIAFYAGLVPRVIHTVEWTTPVILSGYRATGSWAGSILQIICVVCGVFIYRPFIRLYEEQSDQRLIQNVKNLVDELKREEECNTISPLTKREDELGKTARMLAAELKDAVEKKMLFLMYQPQVDSSGKCVGAEALIRWNHPTVGYIYPPLIIQLAKEKHFLHQIEEQIFDDAAAAIAELNGNVDPDFELSVNITNDSLQWDGFENCVARSVEKHKIDCHQLCLEITEQDAFSSSNDVVEKLKNLKKKGHRFLIDDFGMGHTSLLYLQTDYFDVVKLDGVLTRDVIENGRKSDIISSIIHLGHSLKYATVAEWVESQDQKDKLQDLGCDLFQGYLYSKPLRLEEFMDWVKEHK